MAIRTIALSLSLIFVLTLAACGDDTDKDNGGNAPTNGGTENSSTQPLACDAVTWCSSWGPRDDRPETIPDLTGGTISDGVYRLEVGSFVNNALVFRGDEVLVVSDSNFNQRGTWSAEGGVLTLDLDTRCSADGEETFSFEIVYDFAVSGDALYLADQSCSSDFEDGCAADLYRRTDNLCQATDDYTCDVTNCACETTTGPFPTESCF